jgi:hypothetical protein
MYSLCLFLSLYMQFLIMVSTFKSKTYLLMLLVLYMINGWFVVVDRERRCAPHWKVTTMYNTTLANEQRHLHAMFPVALLGPPRRLDREVDGPHLHQQLLCLFTVRATWSKEWAGVGYGRG